MGSKFRLALILLILQGITLLYLAKLADACPPSDGDDDGDDEGLQCGKKGSDCSGKKDCCSRNCKKNRCVCSKLGKPCNNLKDCCSKRSKSFQCKNNVCKRKSTESSSGENDCPNTGNLICYETGSNNCTALMGTDSDQKCDSGFTCCQLPDGTGSGGGDTGNATTPTGSEIEV